MAQSEYEKQANDFLEAGKIDFAVVFVGNDCPKFCDDAWKGIAMGDVNTFPRKTHIHGKHYRCTFTRRPQSGDSPKASGSPLVVDFWNSYNDEEFNWWKDIPSFLQKNNYSARSGLLQLHGAGPGPKRRLTAYDVLASLTKSEPGTFEEFCSDFGYDTDSRRAEDTWRAVTEEWIKAKRFFTAKELEAAQEIS